jgi:plastocyanin
MLSLRVLVLSSLPLLAIACAGSDSAPPPAPSPVPSPLQPPGAGSSSVTIPMGASTLGDRAYNPGEIAVAVGSTVTWVNADTVSHTSTSDAGQWDSGVVAPGGQFSSNFPAAGTFPYHCTIHPGMIARVVVR